jgi:hypothetical protein
MDEGKMVNEIIEYLVTTPGIGRVVSENKDAPPDPPYVRVENVPVIRVDKSLKGGSQRATGYLSISSITQLNRFTTAGLAIFDLVNARFAARLILPFDGGKIIIGDVYSIKGYPDGAGWRQPMRVNYSAIKA